MKIILTILVAMFVASIAAAIIVGVMPMEHFIIAAIIAIILTLITAGLMYLMRYILAPHKGETNRSEDINHIDNPPGS